MQLTQMSSRQRAVAVMKDEYPWYQRLWQHMLIKHKRTDEVFRSGRRCNSYVFSFKYITITVIYSIYDKKFTRLEFSKEEK